MMDINQLLNKILSTPKDNTLYLMEKFPCNTGLFASNGNVQYMAHNEEHCSDMSIKTDFLCLETNIYVSAFNASVPSFENGHYNSVELILTETSDSESNLSAFVNLCLAHATYMSGRDFMAFFDSLVELFQLPKEQHYKNLIGLMGELLFIEYIYQNHGIDLSTYWYTDGPSSKLDFVCLSANFEVKTTAREALSFTIKHDQLFSSADKNYLVAIVLEENNTGRTIEDIISGLLDSPGYCNGLQFSINLEKEKRRVSPVDAKNKRFVLKKIYAYPASNINPFGDIPDCVEDLSYKIDLLPFKEIQLTDVLPRTE